MELRFRPARPVPYGAGEVRHHHRPKQMQGSLQRTARQGKLIYACNGLLIVHSRVGHWVVPPTMVLRLQEGSAYRTYNAEHVALQKLVFSETLNQYLPIQDALYTLTPKSRKIIRQLASSVDDRQPNDKKMLALINKLNQAGTRKHKMLPLCLGLPSDPRLACIHHYEYANLDAPKTLQDWASELKNDTRTLHRLFVQEFGMSFVQWRQQTRLLIALEWLAGGRQVIDVALDLGYQSQSAFTAMFRRNVGITPSDWKAVSDRDRAGL